MKNEAYRREVDRRLAELEQAELESEIDRFCDYLQKLTAWTNKVGSGEPMEDPPEPYRAPAVQTVKEVPNGN